MRAGGCTVQQALTPEAANTVKQALSLARRRGHAQVTPLHVASTMLSSSAGLLRTACLRSHSHPLQCKALELCFNVALNRLPASPSSSPLLGSHQHHPSISNALVAAFKRAQAHQRRGSVESQQQPMLAVKIELEQLIISILDDPSVSRVMREAGFLSTQVKANAEQAVSSEICANQNFNPSKPKEFTKAMPLDQVRNDDVMSIIDSLVRMRKRSVVVVGDCLANTEGVVRRVMDRVEKGEVPEALKNLQFITLPLFSFRLMTRDEVDQKVGELRCLVKSSCLGRGIVLYLGDLKWAAEYRISYEEKGRGYYCPVDHVAMEINRLLYGGRGRFWLMGIATYQTYMRCKIGNPSLEAVWELQALAIPAGSLELTLHCDSDSQRQFKGNHSRDGPCWSFLEDEEKNQFNCADCSVKCEPEPCCLPNHLNSSIGSVTSSLPLWLQLYKEESKRSASNDRDCIKHLCKKWNSGHSSHKHHQSEITLNFSSASPSSSISSYDQRYSSLQQWREHGRWASKTINEGFESNSRLYFQEHCINLKPISNSTSSSDTMEVEYRKKFMELNAENLKTLCNTLERKVPWQSGITPEIASTILQCRSGMMRSKELSVSKRMAEETWLLFLGRDTLGKEKIAKELANLVFGSRTNFVSIEINTYSSSKSGCSDDFRNKRSRSEASDSYLERFTEAIRSNPHRVILMEDIEQVDSHSQIGIKHAIESGRLPSYNGEDVSVSDAIMILCCENFDSRSRACSPPVRQKSGSEEALDGEGGNEIGSCVCLDLNLSAGDEDMEGCFFDDAGLLESVDRSFYFNLPEDL